MRSNGSFVFTRSQLGQAASFIAASALLVGLLVLIWQGSFTSQVALIFVIALLSVAAWALLAPREFVGFITGRQARRGTIAFFSTLLIVGIVILAYIIVERSVITLDMTDARSFTLSSETKRILEQVNRPIRITGFYSPQLLPSQELDDSFFRLYEAASGGLITREYIDPIAEPARAEVFRVDQDGQVFLSYLNDDGTVDQSSIMFVPRAERQERDMTQAIARLLAAGNFTVYFTTGHGELSITDQRGTGISIASQLLLQNGFNTFPLDLKQLVENGQNIPQNASALVIARPLEQFSQDVINLLDEYLNQGGGVYIMADAVVSDAPFLAQDSMFNNYLWQNWGIRMLDAVVVEDGIPGAASPFDVIAYAVSISPITANIDPASDIETAPIFHIARAIEVDPDPPVNNGSVIRTTEISYGETNIAAVLQTNTTEATPGEDFLGPLTTVAFAFKADNNGETQGQIILVGDSDFVTDGRLGNPIGNAYLFVDGIGWMTSFNEQVSIAPQAVGGAQPLVFVAPATLDTINFVMLLLMPGFVLVFGILVWFSRSRR